MRFIFALGLALAVAPPASAQFFRLMESIPAPTHQDVAPGTDQGSEDSLPYEYRRQPVFYRSHEAPGTIIIDTSERFLYLIRSNTTAIRYGIGVGRDGFDLDRNPGASRASRNGRTGRRRPR